MGNSGENTNSIKLLDDFQLYSIIHSKDLDDNLINLAKKELNSRNLSEEELLRLQNKFNKYYSSENQVEESIHIYFPLITPFLVRRHLMNIELLKSSGATDKMKKYRLFFYLGLMVYIVIAYYFIKYSLNR